MMYFRIVIPFCTNSDPSESEAILCHTALSQCSSCVGEIFLCTCHKKETILREIRFGTWAHLLPISCAFMHYKIRVAEFTPDFFTTVNSKPVVQIACIRWFGIALHPTFYVRCLYDGCTVPLDAAHGSEVAAGSASWTVCLQRRTSVVRKTAYV